MSPKRNNMIPNAHFHKKWQKWVRTWFNQPARKQRRRTRRQEKARRVAPRPAAGPLRPAVRCPTLRYNMRQRLGRGFSLDELRAAGLNRNFARTIGIAVDHRRKNRSVESLQVNVQRLKEYHSRLILYPRNAKKPAAGEATTEEWAAVVKQQQPSSGAAGKTRVILPLRRSTSAKDKARVPSKEESAYHAFHSLRQARACKRLHGKRQKRAAEAEAK